MFVRVDGRGGTASPNNNTTHMPPHHSTLSIIKCPTLFHLEFYLQHNWWDPAVLTDESIDVVYDTVGQPLTGTYKTSSIEE